MYASDGKQQPKKDKENKIWKHFYVLRYNSLAIEYDIINGYVYHFHGIVLTCEANSDRIVCS